MTSFMICDDEDLKKFFKVSSSDGLVFCSICC